LGTWDWGGKTLDLLPKLRKFYHEPTKDEGVLTLKHLWIFGENMLKIQNFIRFIVVFGFLTACVSSIQDFQSESNGVKLRLTPQLEGSFLASRDVDIYIWKKIAPCQYETLGVIRNKDLPKTISLSPDQDYNLRTVFILRDTQVRGTIVSDHVFTPKIGSAYEYIATYNKIGHGVRLIENGKNLPYEAPCLSR